MVHVQQRLVSCRWYNDISSEQKTQHLSACSAIKNVSVLSLVPSRSRYVPACYVVPGTLSLDRFLVELVVCVLSSVCLARCLEKTASLFVSTASSTFFQTLSHSLLHLRVTFNRVARWCHRFVAVWPILLGWRLLAHPLPMSTSQHPR